MALSRVAPIMINDFFPQQIMFEGKPAYVVNNMVFQDVEWSALHVTWMSNLILMVECVRKHRADRLAVFK